MVRGLKKVFAAVCLPPALMALLATSAFARPMHHRHRVGISTNPQSLKKPDNIIRDEFSRALKQLCKNADFVLVGDTKHTSVDIKSRLSNPDFAKAVKSCGISQVFTEDPVGVQPEIDKLATGEINLEEYIAARKEKIVAVHDTPADVEQALDTKDAELTQQLQAQGV